MSGPTCGRCSQENPPEARFCRSCGAAIGFECAACGAALPPSARFCGECGRPVEDRAPASYTPRHLREQILAVRGAIRGERKQVTVLFADMVRSTALALELGPERLHRVVERFFAVALEEVHRYEGTVNQFLGDGFMALFGAPIAHEDHARRALLAALGLRERAEVELRIGINSGLVVMGTIGDDLRMDYTAFGDAIILASRLQDAAPPGEVFVSQRTADKVGGYFSFEPLRPVQVKEQTVSPLRLLGPGARTSPIDQPRSRTPLVGRAPELEALQDILDDVTSGQGRLVGISGEAGVGKSRLVFECCRLARERAAVLEGRCLSYGSRMPYLPVLDVVRQVCGVAVGDAPERVASTIDRTLASLDLDPSHARYLLHALGVGGGHELLRLDPPMILRGTFDAVRELLVAEARRRPIVLVIEDLHWVDHTSHELLLELVDGLASEPVLLLATYRPTYTPPWLAKPFAEHVELGPLATSDSERMVRSILGGAGDQVTSIVARGEGNPFFLEELANAESGRTEADGANVPDTVQDVLAARIDALDTAQKRAIQVGAVLGREFPLTLGEAVWDGAAPLPPVLEELERLDFLREQRVAGTRAFTFKHALTRDVAYDGLLESRREELHARAGAALEQAYHGRLHEQCEVLAHHYARSADRGRAADYLELANRKAASRHAMAEAIGYLYDALAILEALPDTDANRRRRLALVFDQTSEFHWTNRHREFHELLLRHEPLVVALDDPSVSGTFYSRLSHRQLIFGHYDTALDTATRGLEACDVAGNVEAGALCCMVQIWAHMMRGELAGATRAHAEARKRLAVEFQSIWYMYAQAGVGLAHLMAGRWDDALRELDEAARTGVERGDAGTTSFSSAIAALVCQEQGDSERAHDLAGIAAELAPTVYFRGYAFAFGFSAAALRRAGQLEQGLAALEQVAPTIRASGHELGWSFAAWRLSLAYIEAGHVARARSLLLEIHDAAVRTGAMFFIGATQRVLAELALADGDSATAVQLLRPAIETLSAHGCENELRLARAALAAADAASSSAPRAGGS